MEIPGHIEEAIGQAVAHHLETELGDRGLLLSADRLTRARAEAAQRGRHLRTCVVHRCYPIGGREGTALAIEWGSEGAAARVDAALAFGASTAALLAPRRHDAEPPAGSGELLGAIFNLGIGLVDGLCDGDGEVGERFLRIVQGQNLAAAAEERWPRGWLRAELAPALAADATVAFTVDIIEVFFEALHEAYPDDARLPLRRDVGAQLDAALEAERQSVDRSAGLTTREQLIECSRRTSVLPFQIIQTLAIGDLAPPEPSAGTLLGEAMWRIDDLVDLCQDARSGALNGVLLATTDGPGDPHRERDLLAVLERLLASTEIAGAAAQAAESLSAGLHLASGARASQDHGPSLSFLHFIQRYAGVTPRQMS